MAHMIDFTTGKAGMAFTGETPWHGLGQRLTRGADLDIWRVEAGLDWDAKRAVVQFEDDGQMHKGESHILYRSDSFDQLGIVSPSYKIVQPRDVLEFFRDLVGKGDLELETAGSIDGGRKVWAMAHTGHGFRIKGQDEVKGYLLLSTSFDGSLATKAQFTSVRVVCNNTLSIATKESKGAVVVPHSSTFDATGAKIELGILDGAFDQFEEKAGMLADRKLSNKEAMELLASIMIPGYEPGKEEQTEVSTKRRNQVTTVFQMFQGMGKGAEFASAKGTAWGLVNAVTEWVDWQQGNNANNRFRSAQFGPGADLKQDAMSKALALCA